MKEFNLDTKNYFKYLKKIFYLQLILSQLLSTDFKFRKSIERKQINLKVIF